MLTSSTMRRALSFATARIREFLRRIAWGCPNDELRLNTASMISQGEMMRNVAPTRVSRKRIS